MEDFIKLYLERLRESQEVYADKYLAMHYAEMAYRQEIPEDVLDSAVNANDSKANRYLPPILTYVVNAYKRELTVNNPQHIIKGNNQTGKRVVKEYNQKMGEIFSYHNWGQKSQYAYHMGLVKGTIISETIYKPIRELTMSIDGKTVETSNMGGGVDYIAYDPLMCAPDPNANPQNIKDTMRWCIVTKGFYTAEYIKDVYKKEVKNGRQMTYLNEQNDLFIRTEKLKAGMDMYRKKNTHVVRDYYLLDGYIYTILDDAEVIAKRPNSMGIVGRVPINICPLKPDPHSVFGFTWWDIIKHPTMVVARVANQVLDNNDYNNNFPLVTIAGTAAQLSEIDGTDRKIIEVNPQGEKMDVSQLIQKLQFPEITQGASFIYQMAMAHIQFLTGVTPASAGMQTKQMRVAGEAEIINNAIVTNSSDIVLNMESSYINACIWDTLRIFARFFDDFEFQYITKDFLKNYKNIHIVNGSTLASDKVRATDLANIKMQLVQMFPQLVDAPQVVDEYLRAYGEAVPESILRTADQIANTTPALELLAQQRVQQ